MHKQKRRHFEGLTSLEPVTLEKRFTLPELEEDEAHGLLNFVKRSIPSNSSIINAENMLLDYFNQSIEEENNNNNINHSKKLHLCEIAKEWICGQPKELYLGWGVKEGRHIYIREMDKEWKNSDQGTQEVAQELENEIRLNADEDDCISWGQGNGGVFSVKSAYEFLLSRWKLKEEEIDEELLRNLKTLWKAKAP
ncbi:hypothetical protein RIF29_34277 [Crotalaria pallida]|uniref:Uncharacterized protein n=1 Tax=Crotalaria pallida TaxID=3830 RepID=A0AAN9E985_CROPI